MTRNKSGPSHFIAIEIDNVKIQKGLRKVMYEIIKNQPEFRYLKVDFGRNHVTLMTLDIPNDKIENVKVIFERIVNNFKSRFQKPMMEIKNTKITESGKLIAAEARTKNNNDTDLIMKLTKELRENIIKLPNINCSCVYHEEWHVTLFNCAIFSSGKVKKSSFFNDKNLLNEYKNHCYGEQEIISFLLMSRQEITDHNEYKCISEVFVK